MTCRMPEGTVQKAGFALISTAANDRILNRW